MRLIYATAEQWPTFRADVNILFGKYLPKHGIQSDLVTTRSINQTENRPWTGGNGYLTSGAYKGVIGQIIQFLYQLWVIFRFSINDYNAIQVRDLPLLAYFALKIARLRRLPFYYWMSFPRPEGQIFLAQERRLTEGWAKFIGPWVRGRLWRYVLYKKVLPEADHIFVQSVQMMADLSIRGIHKSKMTPIPMGVDMAMINTCTTPHVNDLRLLGKRVIIYLGTQDRPRQIEVLFDMLALVKAKIPNVILILVGDTNDSVHRNFLHEYAIKTGVADDVIWTGWLPIMKGWSYVKLAEVGLSPFPRGFLLDSASPTKVGEYLALGVPVVCNDNPDQAAIIQETGAGRCVPYTAENFSKAVIQLLDMDPADRKILIEAGRHYLTTERDYAVIGERLARCYEALSSKEISISHR